MAEKEGYEITIASPKGGIVPVDPESLKSLMLDKISKVDLVYLAGGHGTMYDFPDDKNLQTIIRNQYESDKLVAAICHGVGGLLNVKLSNGEYLIKGKKITGFNWFEESLAGRKKEVPFNLEVALKERGAVYKKAFIPMMSKVLINGNLITGQNPFSSKETAKVVKVELAKQQK
jgi:putative intracellular protease/amidase